MEMHRERARNERGQFMAWPPCACCGYQCTSQLELMESNDGLPWKYCTGCDPRIDGPYICECRQFRLGGAKEQTS